MRESHYRIAGDYNLQINPPEEEPEPEIAIPKIEIAVNYGIKEMYCFNRQRVKSGTAWASGIPTDGSPIILYQILVQ